MNESLKATALRCDAAIDSARAELVQAIRQAYAEGMTQAQIAEQVGRSQPEVNRLLRFHGNSPTAKKLRAHSDQIRAALRATGGRNVRVFGSVATGTESPSSDVDILFDMQQPMSLMELSAVEAALSKLLDARVDLVAESSLREDLREGILAEAVLL